jgi:hypothetical protein
MSALDGWPVVEPWLCRRRRELVITRTWCTVTARKTTAAITRSWPLNTRSAARAIRIPEPNCSSLTLSAPESAESDATAGSTVPLRIPPSRPPPLPPPSVCRPFALARPNPEIRLQISAIAEFRRACNRKCLGGLGKGGRDLSICFLSIEGRIGPFCPPPPETEVLFSASRAARAAVVPERRGAREAGAWQRWPD